MRRRFARFGGQLIILLSLAACTTINQSGNGNNVCAEHAGCSQRAGSQPSAHSSRGSGSDSSSSFVSSPSMSDASPVSPSPSQSTITVTPPRPPQYLAQVQFANTNTAEVGTGLKTIDKTTYPNSVWLCSDLELLANINCDSSSAPYWVDYNVPAGYSKFSATVGYSNHSPGNCDVIVQVFGDKTELYKHEIYYGDSIPVSYQVKKYLRIRLEIIPKKGMMCVTVFGSAEFKS